jgi:hypothetical protein
MNDKPRRGIKENLLRLLLSRWLFILAALVLVYSLIGFFLFPYFFKNYVQRYGIENLASRLTVKKVEFNPFTMTLRAKDFRLEEKNGTLILRFDFFSASLGISSLYYRAWTFSKVTMQNPFLNVVVEIDGASNISRLHKGSTSSEGKRRIPNVLLENVVLRGGRLDFADQRRSPAARVRVLSIDVDIKNLTDLPERTGGYLISGRTEEGEKVKWKGTISLSPLHSVGSMAIEDLNLPTVWHFVQNGIELLAPAGKVAVQCNYLFDLEAPTVKLSLSKVNFSLSDFAISPSDRSKLGISRAGGTFSATIHRTGNQVEGTVREMSASVEGLSLNLSGEEEPLLKLARAELLGGELDLGKRRAEFDRLRLMQGSTEILVRENGEINWSVLRGVVLNAKGEKKQETGEISSSAWSASIASLEARNFRVALTDLSTSPPARASLESVGLTLDDLSTDPEASMKFAFHAKVKEGGEISVDGSAKVGVRKGEGEINVKDLSLLPLQPYLRRMARLRLESGKMNVSGRLAYDASGEGGRFVYRGKMSLPSVLLVEEESGDPFLSWDLLFSSGVIFTLPPNALQVEVVDLVKPWSKFIVLKNHSTNISEIVEKNKVQGHRKDTSGQGMKVDVDRIQVKDGSLRFADLSLRSQFETLIHSLNGVVTGVSSAPKDRAGIELDGVVDQYGTARIRGKMNVFEPTGSTDVRMHFENIDMVHFNPYAVRFAGYRIASGKLSLGLRYKIENSQLLGENHIIADQFVLGKRVGSPTALDLPIALAVALLKDSRGVIDIGLPVQGDLRDPHFEFSQLVSKALASLLTKIVTAPFAWLAALVGAGEKNLDVVFFRPGDAILLPPQKEKLNKLSEGLQRRPEIRINVQGGYNRKLDVRALRSMLMRDRLAAKQYPAFKPGEEPGPVVFDNHETQAAIEALFLQNHSSEELSKLREEFQKSLGTSKESPGAKNRSKEWTDFYRKLYRGMEEGMEIPDTKIEELGRARAAVVKQYMVQERGIDAARIDMLQPEQTESHGREVVTKLSLGSIISMSLQRPGQIKLLAMTRITLLPGRGKTNTGSAPLSLPVFRVE